MPGRAPHETDTARAALPAHVRRTLAPGIESEMSHSDGLEAKAIMKQTPPARCASSADTFASSLQPLLCRQSNFTPRGWCSTVYRHR